jgi:hypothetical protein
VKTWELKFRSGYVDTSLEFYMLRIMRISSVYFFCLSGILDAKKNGQIVQEFCRRGAGLLVLMTSLSFLMNT